MRSDNRWCYRAQCFATARAIASKADIKKYGVAFQSRLGRTPWIKPYTDLELPKLASLGIKNLAVICPSFTADCLETLEEIGIRAREEWCKLTGGSLTLIPCVNDDDLWVKNFSEQLVETKKAQQ
jgi:ferrochelatase